MRSNSEQIPLDAHDVSDVLLVWWDVILLN